MEQITQFFLLGESPTLKAVAAEHIMKRWNMFLKELLIKSC